MIEIVNNTETSSTTSNTGTGKKETTTGMDPSSNDGSTTVVTSAMNGISPYQNNEMGKNITVWNQQQQAQQQPQQDTGGPIDSTMKIQQQVESTSSQQKPTNASDGISTSNDNNSTNNDYFVKPNNDVAPTKALQQQGHDTLSSISPPPLPPTGIVSFTTTATTTTSNEYPSRPSRESVLQRLSEALLRRSLTQIDLSQRGLQPSDARLVKMALLQNSNLSVLKLAYNNLQDHGMATLASGVAAHKSLRLLDLGFNNIGDQGIRALATAMSQSVRDSSHNNNNNNGHNNSGRNTMMTSPKPSSSSTSTSSSLSQCSTLRTLYLAGNLIGQDGAMAIADIIRLDSSTIEKLYMTGNRIGGEGVRAITEASLEKELSSLDVLKLSDDEEMSEVSTTKDTVGNKIRPLPSVSQQNFRGMQELFLGGTGMGRTGCNAVARLLESSTTIKVISLPNCDIGDEDVNALAASIKLNKNRLPLESIQLSFNNITQKGAECLANSLWGSLTLKELEIDNNKIGDRGAHHVAAIIPTLTSLQVLDVGFNSIKTSGLTAIMKSVAESKSLSSLSVSGNPVDVNAAKAIAYALAYNQCLEQMFLVHCSIIHEGQRHVVAGIVSNRRTSLVKLTGIDVGPVIVTLGFPTALKHWTNEQILNFIHLMWNKSDGGLTAEEDSERSSDPLNLLDNGRDGQNHHGPLDHAIVVDVAKRAFERLVSNGVDVFSRRSSSIVDPSFGSPLASNRIVVESSTNGVVDQHGEQLTVNGESNSNHSNDIGAEPIAYSAQSRSFVAPPESKQPSEKEAPDPERKKRVVEWLCTHIQYLNELSQRPFNPRELWKLHQHYFSPVVNESGGSYAQSSEGGMVVSSVPEVTHVYHGGSAITPSTTSSVEENLSVPMSDPVLPGSAGPSPMSLLKRKVSYRHLGDAVQSIQMNDSKIDTTVLKGGVVAKMIERGHTGHSLPPKTKRARRNRTRISFVPRVKAKLDSYLDVCHEKALITMRQLYYVEQAILAGQVHPLDPASSSRTHLYGTLASEAEMIIVDMI